MTPETTVNPKGLVFARQNTKDGVSPFDLFTYDYRTSIIKKPDGSVVFEMKNVEVPTGWSQVATDIMAQKYFRKAGVPQKDGSLGAETSAKQVVHRLANCWRQWGEKYGYFLGSDDAQVFYDELVYSMLSQACAPNSPQWFNTGLHSSYAISGKPQGHYFVDPETEKLMKSTSAYERPQPHACFILSVSDDLVNEGGIMDLWVREARIFKYGSGVGTNFSAIRGAGEKLSGGGTSSGLMSFLKIGDRAAGAIKSGGTTRRAAKMVCLDLDHPEAMDFIEWKKKEEQKVAVLIESGYSNDYEGEAYNTVSGQNSNNSLRMPNSFFKKLENKGHGNAFEAGLGFFSPLGQNEHWRFEGIGAIQFGKAENNFSTYKLTNSFTKPSLQFTLAYKHKYWELAFSNKFGVVSLNNIVYAPKDTANKPWEKLQNAMDKPTRFVYEPGLTLRAGIPELKFQFYLGLSPMFGSNWPNDAMIFSIGLSSTFGRQKYRGMNW